MSGKIINVRGTGTMRPYKGQKTINTGSQPERRPVRHLNDGPAPPPNITWGQGDGQRKPDSQLGKQNATPHNIPGPKPRGSVFNKGEW